MRRFVSKAARSTTIALTLVLAITGAALAKEKDSYLTGVNRCGAWCDTHNTTLASLHKCYVKCDKYWRKNGSDMRVTLGPILVNPMLETNPAASNPQSSGDN